ncbi:chromate reductase [Paraperlucidibaca baekdonensis]|uniref:Chromate reductase n=1 Tax=Paraperlucidibaca baekdonensis TaxID=748120 RepID=A0A3E0H6I9_9GAMM|nr:NAD(P)H-dependent oxidoreductase [Paraperlucidibaca baekdonensis]REH39111.1 chromate reductase [Paraperlucidibaca baekdonensis]
MKPIHVLTISGSLRNASLNTQALRAAEQLAPDGMVFSHADLHGLPHYDQDLRDAEIPEAVIRLDAQVRAADALLIATPEYNYSIPGVLKDAIDWLSRMPDQPLNGKPAALLSASMGALGGVRAQYHLRQMLIYINVHVLNRPEIMIASAHERFDSQGQLIHAATAEMMREQLGALAQWTNTLRGN